jgi:hypothetical protein
VQLVRVLRIVENEEITNKALKDKYNEKTQNMRDSILLASDNEEDEEDKMT